MPAGEGVRAQHHPLAKTHPHVRMAGCTHYRPWRVMFGAIAASVLLDAGGQAFAGSSAVVMMYQRFGERETPSRTIDLERFDAHLRVIARRGLNVIPLPDIVAALRSGRVLPERTIALTVDGASRSFYVEAWPRLRRAGLPVTLFVSTDAVDEGRPSHMSWDEIREIVRGGATIGSLSASHRRLPPLGRAVAGRDIGKVARRLEEELGMKPQLFSYPYGAMSLAVRDAVLANGYVAAFGQHSGVLHAGSRFDFLPRFPMTGRHSAARRFRLAAEALPLAVSDITPADPYLVAGRNPPGLGFTVTGEALAHIDLLACYVSGRGRARIERIGPARVELRFDRAFPPGRARLNCTMPGPQGRWRWHGTQFFVPHPGQAG